MFGFVHKSLREWNGFYQNFKLAKMKNFRALKIGGNGIFANIQLNTRATVKKIDLLDTP